MRGWKVINGRDTGGSYFVALILGGIIVLIFAHVTGMWDLLWYLGRKVGEGLQALGI